MTDYTTQIQLMTQSSVEDSKFELQRKSGNYYNDSVQAVNAQKLFFEICEALNLTYTANQLGASGYNDVAKVGYQLVNLALTFHESVASIVQPIMEKVIPVKPESFIKWFYNDPQRGITSQTMKLEGHSPADAFYPQMNKSLKDFAKEFADSSANVLLLIGPPGTGKTSFIRGLVRNMGFETWVTYDQEIQENEQFYVSFASISGSDYETDVATAVAGQMINLGSFNLNAPMKQVSKTPAYKYWQNPVQPNGNVGRCLVMEDADSMLGKRTDGNKLMNRLLNLSDGLVSIPKRKIIVTTNLPGLKDVDEAILRPGRCFAVVAFRHLNKDEATKACAAIGRDAPKLDKEKMTLSEALNGNLEHQMVVQRIGF